ncbi:terpenoid synthase [Fomitiporia mediterranea MF3/22]|uniref:terpenoid synthase n=1 Tax=Fomitiporia mediterranea (strain MF3/22) TaxID=694068 RepID=UPI0004407F2A|nr:terpenoid synthase [Fomitiporia mediterranea MF3/22]EJD04498.1 terpenoid synthase [Fomitiporia mediterranea MF3/22]
MDQFTQLAIPDLLLLTPFPWDKGNPHYSSEKKESTEWMLKYGVFSDHRRDRLNTINIELFGAYTYPYADAEALRIVTDFVMILFALDEFTDLQDQDGAKATSDIFVNALNGVSGNDNSPIALFTKDFMARLSRIASPEVRERFVTHCSAYIDACTREAGWRATNKIPSFEEYTHLRRDNGGAQTTFDLIEAVLGVTLRVPADVFEDPNFQLLHCSMNDMICLANDIYSYPMEIADGIEQVNAITTIKHEKAISPQEAVDFVTDHYKKLIEIVDSCKQNIRSFGPEVDDAIHKYIYGMEQQVYGYIVWCFSTPRYFGKECEEVRHTLTMKVMQRSL